MSINKGCNMKRTFYSLMLMFLTVGTISAQQKIEKMAKELARSVPGECEMRGTNTNGYRFNTILPIDLIRPSLLDSLKSAFNAEVANADYVAVMKNRNYYDKGDTLSYTLGWGKIDEQCLQQNKKFDYGPSERGRLTQPFTSYYATLDIVNDMVSFLYDNSYLHSEASPKPYNPSGFEALLDQVKAMTNVRKKKVKFPPNQYHRDTVLGYEYIIGQDADSLFRRFGEFLIQDSFNGNRPGYFRYALQHKYTNYHEDQCYVYFDLNNVNNGRRVEICVRQGQLLILDYEGSGVGNWQQMLEHESDSLHFANMKYSLLQVGDRYYALKNAAHSMIEWFGPEWEKPLLSYEVSELKTYKADVRPAAQPYLGRQYYTVTVRYQHQKERGIKEDFAAIVDVWNDMKEPKYNPYDPTTPKMITFPNGDTVDFIEKSFQKRSKERIDEWRKEERGKNKL